jgi:hypothetical protein
MWYESDFFTSLALGVDNWEIGVTYTSYLSPNDSFGTVKELALGASMDDSGLFGRFAVAPHAVLAIEMDGQADGGTGEGVYLELGVEPGLPANDLPLSVSFPVNLGLSLSDYYEHPVPGDVTFGYFSIGVSVAAPLNVPESLGALELGGGISLFSLGDSLELINNGDQFQPVASFGLSLTY